VKASLRFLVPCVVLALGACSGGDRAAGGLPGADGAPGGAPPASAAAARRPGPPPPPVSTWQGGWTPTRTPKFHFEDREAVPDEDLLRYHVVLKLEIDGEDAGSMVFGLWPQVAPEAVRNFLRLCDEGFYDGTPFFQVRRRAFVRGGSRDGKPDGQSPYGFLPDESTFDPKWSHRYGVLSMYRGPHPDSASSQFFVVCNESPEVARFNGRFTAFGRLVAGVEALEALASVPVVRTPDGKTAGQPAVPVVLKEAVVVARPAPPPAEPIRRPTDFLGGEPAVVELQNLLVGFQGSMAGDETRSREEAERLARELVERARAGEDFDALVREYSDEEMPDFVEPPGRYLIVNRGADDWENFEEWVALQAEQGPILRDLQERFERGEITQAEVEAAIREADARLGWTQRQYRLQTIPRARLGPGFGDLAFRLGVGEIGLLEYDPTTAPFGYQVVRRIR